MRIKIYQWADGANVLKFDGDRHSGYFPLAYMNVIDKWIANGERSQGDKLFLDRWHYAMIG